MYLLGLDLGTSSLKALLLTPDGKLAGLGQAAYPILTFRHGWAEQRPENWWWAAQEATAQALHNAGKTGNTVAAIGLSGQMHGVVLCAADQSLLYPAVIWSDTRTTSLLGQFGERVPRRMWPRLGGPPAPGFAGLTLFWFTQHHPRLLEGASVALQPKDWLRLRLTGEARAELTDASATALMDVGQRRWCREVSARLALPDSLFPPLLESGSQAGTLSKSAAQALGLRVGIPVAAGAADQAAAAVANGVLEEGQTQLLLGTGGQVVQVLGEPRADPHLQTHLFCHAPQGRWYRLAATLNCGLALNWVRNILGLEWPQFFGLAAESPAGAGGLIFLPHLIGERTPHMNPSALGAWVGLSSRHTRADLARAALEGVCYALREAVEALKSSPQTLRVSGGGTKHPLWVQTLADVLGQPLEVAQSEDSSAWGAALLGGLATGLYPNYQALSGCGVGAARQILPGQAELYQAGFLQFRETYQRLESIWQLEVMHR